MVNLFLNFYKIREYCKRKLIITYWWKIIEIDK